jgi:predicted helicase
LTLPLFHKEPIKRGRHLAQIMGGKAKRIRGNVLDILERQEETDIHKVRNTIKKLLVHDMDNDSFADMYAQTLVYGLFVARFYDESGDNFSRREARDLVPRSNPFLAHFFDHISGVNFEKKLSHIVDELCEVFCHANIPNLMEQYFGRDLWGNDKEGPDPVIHFYEDFLKEYDSQLRKKMGAYYTPTPVVRFMVKAVDELLQKEFGFLKGLADTSKYESGFHKVQVLDPATGTGTFISAVIRLIYERILDTGQKGSWTSYVHHDLLPRIHAFELMMGPYTIAHLKLSMAFEKTGFKYFNNTRLGIYLTNSLEEADQNDLGLGDLGLSGSIAEEAKEARKIKNEKPVMVVIGNPPYSGTSQNKDYTGNDVYKVEPGGKIKLNERNPKWINDDYVKFIRFGESLIEKNGQGIVSMITAHGYIDNPTFRGMRWHLRNTFDKIYVLDLHGNANKKDTTADGGKDENIFDIKTGVSIIFAIKKKGKENKKLARVYKADVFGLREEKFEVLEKGSIENIVWQELPDDTELWVLEGKGKSEYLKGFSITELFPINSVGVVTAKDDILINGDKVELLRNVASFYEIEPEESFIKKISYRPFDTKFVYFDTKLVERSREKLMKHFVNKDNVALVTNRQVKAGNSWQHIIISDSIVESTFTSNKTSEIGSVFPAYLYIDQNEKVPNLDKEIWSKINQVVGETTPENILDYIYAVLYSPTYRERYKEFLRIDFPRVPYPESKKKFFDLVKLGEDLRELHLMVNTSVNYFVTTFPNSGSDEVEKIVYEKHLEAHKKVHGEKINLNRADIGDVWINNQQYFGNVPEKVWNFYIGSYQPAQKYLKDRKGFKLTNNENPAVSKNNQSFV